MERCASSLIYAKLVAKETPESFQSGVGDTEIKGATAHVMREFVDQSDKRYRVRRQ